MDGFVAWSENGGLAMSYYDATDLPVGRLAQQYVLIACAAAATKTTELVSMWRQR